MQNTLIRHIVIFTFKDDMTALEKDAFFNASKKLTTINGVKKFEILKQNSPKNKFEHGFSMEFDNEDLYQTYIANPINQNFVQTQWLKWVTVYMVLDYEPIPLGL
jgi:Stress responsive A/B Barrel Domain